MNRLEMGISNLWNGSIQLVFQLIFASSFKMHHPVEHLKQIYIPSSIFRDYCKLVASSFVLIMSKLMMIPIDMGWTVHSISSEFMQIFSQMRGQRVNNFFFCLEILSNRNFEHTSNAGHVNWQSIDLSHVFIDSHLCSIDTFEKWRKKTTTSTIC